MKYRYLGKTGLSVSRVSLGTMTFGAKNWGCDRETSIRILRAYLESGGNFIDTADIYAGGISEEILGEGLKGIRRDDYVLASKCLFRTGPAPTAGGLSRKHILEACEASLRRLQTDYIDLYYIHGPDPFASVEETMRTLNDLVRQGKVRYIGCSNLFAWQILKANGISLLHHLETFSCGQYLYNLVNRDAEREILPACMDQGMGFTSWSPLAGGFLLGKYQNAEKPSEGSRFSYRMEVDGTRFWHPRGFEAAAKVFTLSRKLSISPLKLALSWVLYQPRVTSIIIGVKNLEQLHENLIVGDWDLPREAWEEVDRETAYDLAHLNQFSTFVRKSIFGIHE